MKRFWNIARWGIVAAIILLSAMNASWVASPAPGILRLIALRTKDEGGCPTIAGAQSAFVKGADYLVIANAAKGGCLSAEQAQIQMPQRKFMVQADGAFEATKPEPWNWDVASATACYDAYFKTGWLGIVPAVCQGKTMLIPLDGQLKVWGWPNRFMARMNAAGVRVILGGEGEPITKGIVRADQLPLVPRDFTGYLLVDDIEHIGPAIRRS